MELEIKKWLQELNSKRIKKHNVVIDNILSLNQSIAGPDISAIAILDLSSWEWKIVLGTTDFGGMTLMDLSKTFDLMNHEWFITGHHGYAFDKISWKFCKV